MNDKEFLEHTALTQAEIESANFDVDSLQQIYDDHNSRIPELLSTSEYIQRELGNVNKVHSTRVRVKSPPSLVRKIIRKRQQDPNRDITPDNYKDEIRDLIGLRAFHLFKEEWKDIHSGIHKKWKLHPNEQPVAYVRKGDDSEIQKTYEDAGCRVDDTKEAGYRSVHYVIQINPTKELFNAEIQVRTLFEEAWSEIDHLVRYPDQLGNKILNDYLLILNRLAGGADEMASSLLRVKEELTLLSSFNQEVEAEKDKVEKELEKSKVELSKVMNDLQLTRGQKERLQQEFDRIPQIYRQSPKEIQKATEKAIADQGQMLLEPSNAFRAAVQAARLAEVMGGATNPIVLAAEISKQLSALGVASKLK